MKQTTTITLPLIVLLFLRVLADTSSYGQRKLLSLEKIQSKHQLLDASPSCIYHKTRTERDSTTLEIKHVDSCLRKTIESQQRLQKRIIQDNDQVQFLQNRIRKCITGELESLSDAQIPITSGTRLKILNYIVTMKLGGMNMTVILDTGSDLTWVQCQPCRSCYTQQEPLFDPRMSFTYTTIPCNSSSCKSFQYASGNFGPCLSNKSTCNYLVNYGDGSYTRGDLGKDQLNLGQASIHNFVFGCGRSNKGLFGGASGLMGLGNSTLSLVTQTSDKFGGLFSYCLPSSNVESSGSLTFGGSSLIYKNTTSISYTRMVRSPGLSTFYMLNLTGLSIGGVRISASTIGKYGVLLDSGTVITRLPPSIYKKFKTEFVKQFSRFLVAPGFSILDTCFNLSSYKDVDIPLVKMEFEGNAEFNVDVDGVLYFAKDDLSQACLAFSSLMYDDEVAIIGNYQQKNVRVVYDTMKSVVGFAEEECSFL